MKSFRLSFANRVFFVIALFNIFCGSAFAIHADFTGDCKVNLADFSILSANWDSPGFLGDLTGDGFVGGDDLEMFSGDWLNNFVCCCCCCCDDGGSIPRMPYGGKFRRVDIHGVPMPDKSPLGEVEEDRLANMAYIDMYSLAPNYSVTDVSVGMEGGELTLEFRRTSGIRSFRYTTDITKKGVTYHPDSLLGPGWDTNLSSRATVITRQPSGFDPSPLKTIQVTDEVGTSYTYFDENQTGQENPFAPDMYHSFSNEAIRTKLFREDPNTLVLEKVFGTRSIFKKVGRFSPPSPSCPCWQDYYRLSNVEWNAPRKLYHLK